MSAVKFETKPIPLQPDSISDGPRKRRKRAPAAGAANDCFTCQNRNIKCSRGRPYCAQCLDAGQDCAGYKTQLTWGVGVASRGKLRGLSLPVAGTKKVAEDTSPPKSKKRTPANASRQSQQPITINSETTRRDFPTTNPAQPIPITDNSQYHSQPVYHSLQHAGHGSISFGPNNGLQSLDNNQHFNTPSEYAGWTSMQSPANQGYSPPQLSPLSYSAPSQPIRYAEHNHPRNYTNHQANPSSYPMSSNLSAIMNPVYPSNEVYPTYPPQDEQYHSRSGYLTPSSAGPTSTLTSSISPWPEEDVEEINRDFDNETAISDTLSVASAPTVFDWSVSLSPFSGVSSVGKTPRMQYLIQYYVEVIAPVIVAFDSPSNPFREQIVTLAANSESLQHAISALAASNLRQRRESGVLSTGKTLPARRSSAAHQSLTNEAWYSAPSLPLREQKREEVYHKYHAVQALNQALANQNLRKDDSVLATLLMLCLFHVCDSGIARFQTQFAGVKKLLTLRQNEIGQTNQSTKWIARLFTWFDAMAATVNEREGQFESHQLELASLSDGEWSYETLAGVDGRLFKIMSKLGRLNILSQNKPVGESPTLVSRPMPSMGTDINTFDGNGWMRIVDDENFFNNKTENPDIREQFWREWREIRYSLQSWNMDTHPSYDSTHHEGLRLTEDQLLDVNNISNAFRYSSLLYTERLGNPRLPSSDEKIQYWVQFALHHIKQVRSDVFLLWPLFITGSECVHEEGRNTIRERCLDIQKDSGFINNASCLALLEKVWQVVPVVSTAFPGGTDEERTMSLMQQEIMDSEVNGFRFREVMLAEGNEGEWIVV